MKKTLTLLSMLLLSSMTFAQVSTWDGTWEPWTHGTGTEADPFLIENAQQLAYLAYRVNNGLDANGTHVSNHDYHYKLMVNVNLNGSEAFQWTPIGYWNSDTDYQCFGGCFDGNNHTVSGLYINSTNKYVGFIAYAEGITIMNLTLNGRVQTTGDDAGGIIGRVNGISVISNCGCNFSGGVSASQNVGGVVGYTDISTITNCYSTGKVITAGDNVYAGSGGIIGYAGTSATITNCRNTGNVTSAGNTPIGGILGNTGYYGEITIINCYNTSYIQSQYTSGGIVGRNNTVTGSIFNCYNSGSIQSVLSGGIVGWHNANITTMTNCYNIGSIIATNSFGGIIGYKSYGQASINNCYYLNTCGGDNSNGGQPMSTEAMRSAEFVDLLNDGSCAWEQDLGNVNSGYPILTMIIVDAITIDPTNVTQSHATLHGLISTENTSIASQGFEYKKTSDSHYQTVNVSGSGNISTTLSGLQPNTEYQYRTFCTPNDCNTYYGELKTFTTLPISITTNDASSVTQTHATINGTLNVGDANVTAQGFEYKQSSNPSYQTISVSGNGAVSHVLSGLMPNTSYTYRTFCIVTGSGTTYGETKTFTTLPVSITTNFATDITANSAILHGIIDISDATLVNKGFEYRAEGEAAYTIVNVAGNNNSFETQITGLQINTVYEYRAFMNIAEVPTTYYGTTRTFEVTWLNQDTICVYDAEMLRWVSEQCNSGTTFQGKYIKLMNDITLPINVPNNMTSIGVYPNYPFKGTFDGNGKHITNLYIDQPNTPYQGFFGYTLNANLYNVGLVNITASGRNYTGGMVAYAENTYLRDCYVNGGTLFALSYCGGLVGYQEQGTNSIISGCYNTCEVSGNNYVGGLVGFSNYSTVRNSYVAALVAAQGEAVGSIIGGANEVLMYYCYFNSELTGQTNAIGWNNTGGGKDGGEAMTSAQMRDPQFVATLNSGLTVHVWKQDYTMHINNGFPILQWQVSTGVEENGFIKAAVYPNPTNGNITIEVEDLKHITISNMLGQVIYESKASGNMFEYDFGKHGAGLYLIRIETVDGVALKKVSVVR